MGKIILFNKHQNRNKKTHKAKQIIENSNGNENLDEFIEYMSSEVSKILDKPETNSFADIEKKERKEFEEKYKDVLSQAPDTAEAQIQYFAGIMLEFLPMIFHGEQKDRFDAYMDFSEFYLSEFDIAYSQYHNEHQKYEKEYPFRFIPLSADTLENELQDCLLQIINSSSAKSSNKRTGIIMWQTCKLFELYHNIIDLFSEKTTKKK